jgi:hypothetical protein
LIFNIFLIILFKFLTPHCNTHQLLPPAQNLVRLLADAGVSHTEDNSGAAVGRRYARADEIGIPFAVTVDYTTLQDSTVTLRERDSMKQVRVKVCAEKRCEGKDVMGEDMKGERCEGQGTENENLLKITNSWIRFHYYYVIWWMRE